MEKDQYNIIRKSDGVGYYYTVSFGWSDGLKGGQTTKVFNTRMQAIGFINDELQKEPAVEIDGVSYPSHVLKLFGWRSLKLVPAIPLEETHSLWKVGMRWVHYNSVSENDGALIYYHKKDWSVVG